VEVVGTPLEPDAIALEARHMAAAARR
jgi:hypothetical protein